MYLQLNSLASYKFAIPCHAMPDLAPNQTNTTVLVSRCTVAQYGQYPDQTKTWHAYPRICNSPPGNENAVPLYAVQFEHVNKCCLPFVLSEILHHKMMVELRE